MTVPSTDEEKKQPAILIIPGTGPNDRDGNPKKKKYHFNLYKELSHFLTDKGFVTLRYDKRGIGESGGDPNRAGLWDFVHDATSAVHFLKEHPNVVMPK
ncbi:serine aminopeptidase domain-containing protein [Salirhabdus salicampi]|uniref:serine aminopeptidase domain-containing protein n=1 Tax=Salirhabdus salicampi TaxID=476102 RepID=UPI0020C365AD|nr:alpha/beta hydrolase [Salirhabdus salicampi]MCP8615718.1 lysophospholipase [Salirhabdus salicampi]